MELVVERKVINGNMRNTNKVHINTLVPKFQFNNKAGNIIKSAICSIAF